MEFYRNVQTKYQDASLQKGLACGDLTCDDVQLIREFVTEKKAVRHWKDHRVQKSTMDLRQWRRFIKKPFRECTIEDIYSGINAMIIGLNCRGKPFAENTKHDYVKVLRWFLFWGVETGRFPKIEKDRVHDIKVPAQNVHTTEPSDLLTADEVVRLIDAAKGSQYAERDQAIISMLFESGVRIGELASLCWRDITSTEYGYRVYVKARKTEHSRITGLQMSAPYLSKWMNSYPGLTSPDKPVFITMWERKSKRPDKQSENGDNGIIYRPMEYFAIVALLRRITDRSGLKKRVHSHLFRKSRITDLIRHNWQEAIVKKAMWGNLNTKQFSTYVVLDEGDFDAELMERSGFKIKQETSKNNPLTPKTCTWCTMINPSTNACCSRCGRPLSEHLMEDSETIIPCGKATTEMTPEERLEWLSDQIAQLKATMIH